MTSCRRVAAFVVLACVTAGGGVRAAQQAPAAVPSPQQPAQAERPAPRIPLEVQIVVAKYQGDRRISSLPYVVSVNTGDRSQLRMGAQVPVQTTAPPTVDGKPLTGVPIGGGPVAYRDVGTAIDCFAYLNDDGTYRLALTIEDTSVYVDNQATVDGALKVGDLPVFRTFRSSNNLILRDGQTRQFTAATDRVSGEVIRVEVTLTVVK
jgi:hypothetical protein